MSSRRCRRARPRAYLSSRESSVPFFLRRLLAPSLSFSLFLALALSVSLSISFAYSLSCASVERYRVPLRGLGVRVGGSRSRARIAGGRAMRGGRARTEPSDGAPRSFMNGPRRLSHIWKRRVDCQPIPALRSPINARLCPCRVIAGRVCVYVHTRRYPHHAACTSSLRATARRHLCPHHATLRALLPSPSSPPFSIAAPLSLRRPLVSPPLHGSPVT